MHYLGLGFPLCRLSLSLFLWAEFPGERRGFASATMIHGFVTVPVLHGQAEWGWWRHRAVPPVQGMLWLSAFTGHSRLQGHRLTGSRGWELLFVSGTCYDTGLTGTGTGGWVLPIFFSEDHTSPGSRGGCCHRLIRARAAGRLPASSWISSFLITV